MRKACGPLLVPPTSRSAITTALVAVSPCDIQFLQAPSCGVLSRNCPRRGCHSAVVCTTSPELTPARRSVSAKHPSVPSRCISSSCARCDAPPSSSTVPAKRLNCTVKRMENPGPCSNPCSTKSRCASKNLSGASRRSVKRSRPLRTRWLRRAADSWKDAAGVASMPLSSAVYAARHSSRAAAAAALVLVPGEAEEEAEVEVEVEGD
mmetsp:Transcript_18122/g.44999  ORF Transcript_18122/g.44999 Transcript_18122/m.44999 type:complete len:207 (+) Transcript_18122:1153-1773(+)